MAIKRVRVDQLKPGMYIHDLNCGWLHHGFLRQQFLLRSEGQVAKLHHQGMHDVYIDTGKGADVPGAPTEAEVQQALQDRLEASGIQKAALPTARVAQKEEAVAAQRILGEAQGVVKDMMQDIRLGKQVDPARALPVVDEINASVLRNPGALLSLGRLKQADTYTFQHCVSVCALLVSFSHALGLDAQAVREAGLGGLLHDVGKMKIPLEILNKPGRLTREEFATMKSHATLSRELLQGTPGISETVVRIASEHHEKVGGCGYPLGLRGEGISQSGRMAAIVDVYDALTSNRVYHKSMEPSEALKKLLEWSGDHLDGELVQHFIRALGIYPVGSLVRLSDGTLAVVVEQHEDLLRPTVRVIYDAERGYRLPPRDLRLDRSDERIDSFEEPDHWNLSPFEWL
jgi:putative nucleotidyltransferase with HDIG domain